MEKHVRYTGSPRGKMVLDNWGSMLPKFVKVFPHEFKRVLGAPRRETPYYVSGSTQGEQVIHG